MHHVINPSRPFPPLFVLQTTKAGLGDLGTRLVIMVSVIKLLLLCLQLTWMRSCLVGCHSAMPLSLKATSPWKAATNNY